MAEPEGSETRTAGGEAARGDPRVTLRAADEADAERLLAWRNDPVTRRHAFTQGRIALPDHRDWLRRRLADPDAVVLVGEDGEGRPCGQVRLDRSGGVALVGVTVAPEARGRGIATALLRGVAASCPLPVDRLRAEIRPGNLASLRAFAKAGFTEAGRDARAVTVEREVAGPGA